MRFPLTFALIAAAAFNVTGQTISDADAKAYEACVGAATQEDGAPAKTIEMCLAPAKAGIPGAQYGLGVALVTRNEAGDRTAGIDWLEKSAASGNPAAAFALAGMLLPQEAPASQARGREMLKMSVCAQYPLAVEALRQGGVSVEKIGCTPPPEEDFDGEWIADLKWVKAGAMPTPAQTYQLKLVLTGDRAQVFMKPASEWVEVKAGKFKVQKLNQMVSVTTLDSGWDFDGEWTEAWTIQLLRLGRDEARVSYLRTVNNPHMPAAFSWRAFSAISEGTARRTPK
jgi:hypothetical protein